MSGESEEKFMAVSVMLSGHELIYDSPNFQGDLAYDDAIEAFQG